MRLILSLMIACFIHGGIISAGDSPIDRGSVLLDGEFSVSITGAGDGNQIFDKETTMGIDDDETFTIISFRPSVGYFATPGFFLGGKFWFERWTIEDNSLTFFGIGPSLGYYFNTAGERSKVKGSVYPYLRGEFMYVNIGAEEGSDDLSDLEFGGGGGILFMISNTVGLNAGASFMILSQSYRDDTNSGWNFRFGVGISTFIY